MISAANDALLVDLVRRLTSEASVFNFLFVRDPLSDISLLCSPLRLHHSLVTTRTTAATESSHNHLQVLDHVTTSTTLHVPGFSIDDTSVGLCLHSRSVTKHFRVLQPRKHLLHVSRFASFEGSGHRVEVREEPGGENAIHITLTTLRGLRRKSEHTFSFERLAFTYEDMKSQNGMFEIRDKLTKISKTEYCRACPVCNVSASASCRCSWRSRRANEVLDFSSLRHNVGLYCGDFSGGCMVELFRHGVQALHASLSCRDAARVEADARGERRREMKERGVALSLATYRLGSEGGRVERGAGVENGLDEGSRLACVLASGVAAEAVPGEGGEGRREKNRLAAARSNLKRKWRNKSLRLHLVILRQRVAELREREHELKCERVGLLQRCFVEGHVGGGAGVELLSPAEEDADSAARGVMVDVAPVVE